MLKSKIHGASITGVHPDYEGSIGIDQKLLEAYAITAAAGSGTITLNGAAARCGMPGDRVIILAYCTLNEREICGHGPNIVYVDSKNRITKKKPSRKPKQWKTCS